MANARRAERAAKSEFHMNDETFHRLNDQVQQAYLKIDGVLAHTLRMNADMIDSAEQMHLPPEQGQRLFANLMQCCETMLGGREKLLAAHREATKIRLRTNQAERADGCYPPWKIDTAEQPKLHIVP